MGRNKNNIVWNQFEMTNNGAIKCKHCAGEFNGRPSATRLKDHLLGVACSGIRSCGVVPDHVKNALAGASSSGKRPRVDPSCSINNYEFRNQGGNGQQTLEALHDIEGILEGSWTSALERWENTSSLHNKMAEIDICRIGPDPSVNEVNNSASASAPQQNNEFQNRMQVDEEFNGENEQMMDEMTAHEISGEPFQIEVLVGEGFQENMNTVLKWLMCAEVSSIGIYGMGGVGKTTLLTHIYNRILKNKSRFGKVYWVTVSQDFSIERLQNLIAKTIDLDFANEVDIKRRAAKLSKALSSKCKFVLILDDLWNDFGVQEVGIPVGTKESKLIVTSRSQKVCSWINCQKEIKLLPLLDEEAWKLFMQTLGHALSPEVEKIARSVVKECSGLPLGIVTMAGSMRRVDDIHEWNNALMELKNSEVRKDDMEPKVFRIMRYSYERLNDPRLQQCLLYCALYPEDFYIVRDELIEHLVVERIIDRKNSRRKASYDKGQTMLNKLVNVCLLEQSVSGRSVKMHDLIRDMAIQIMRECSPSLVEAGQQLTYLPDDKWWMEDAVRVSLMGNRIKKIPTNCSPKCPKLSTLFLCHNDMLRSIPKHFFSQLHGLKVLNLSHTGIRKLPESVTLLGNLIALFLELCGNLQYVPSLRKLGALEVLDLHYCSELEKMPEGLESLSNLNYLDLGLSGVTKLPSGILRNLSHLQFLAFNYLSEAEGVDREQLGCLSNLEALQMCFNGEEDLKNYMHMERQQLSDYYYSVGPIPITKKCSGKHLSFHWCTVSREVLLLKDIQNLNVHFVSIKDGRSLCLKNAIDLKFFHIDGCDEIEYLFCLSSSPSIFRSLETLEVSKMEKLSGLFIGEGDDFVIPIQLPPNDTFSCLKKFKLSYCRSMNKLFPYGLLSNFHNLHELEVQNCSTMEEIIASEEEEQEEEEGRSNTHFTLPNLRLLTLMRLPKLKSICCAKLICDSLQQIYIEFCSELEKIPIYVTHPFVKHVIGNDGNHWRGERFKWARGEQ